MNDTGSIFEWALSLSEILKGTLTNLYSPYFSGPGTSYQWKLELHRPRRHQYVFLKLYLVNSDAKEMRVKYDFTLKPGDVSLSYSDFVMTLVKGVKVFKIPDDCEVDLKLFPLSVFEGFLRSYEIRIRCELKIDVIHGKITSEYQDEGIPDFETLLNDPDFSDFTLKTSSESFNVNKKILSTRSPVFCAMFEHDMKEKIENVVTIPDIDPEIMRELLRYIYCGRVESFDRAKELFNAADKYQVEGLKIKCLKILCDDITVENAVELYVLVNSCSHEELIARVTHYIMDNIKKIYAKASFDALHDSTLLRNLLNKTIVTHLL